MCKKNTTDVLSLVKVNKILQKLNIEKANELDGVLKHVHAISCQKKKDKHDPNNYLPLIIQASTVR